MFLDAKDIPRDSVLRCDILVVGTGAAGATLATELAGSGLEVIVLEGGGLADETETQRLYEGEVDEPKQHGELTRYRRRRFGGTTSVWGGRCAPFDPLDFEARPHVPYSGWPVTRTEMDPYYARAHVYAHTGDYTYRVDEALPGGPPDLVEGFRSEVVLQDQIWRFSLPTDFGRTNRRRLQEAANVRVILHANCSGLRLQPGAEALESVQVSSLGGHRFQVQARDFVLAAGGLETTRLLLTANEVRPEGLGNEHGLLGRFYSSHIAGDLGSVTFTPQARHVVWQYEQTREGVYCKRNLRIHEQAQKDMGLLNFRCILTHPPFGDFTHRNGILSAVYLVKRFFTKQIPPEYSRELASREYRNVREHFRNVLCDAPNFARFSVHWLFRRILATRKFPSVAMPSAANTYTIHFDGEQAPNPSSRVELSREKDALGMNRLSVKWRFTETDLDSVAACHRLLKQELEKTGVARLELDPAMVLDTIRDKVGVGSHHIGTTRMSDDPKTGVVNRNCTLHSVPNLHLAAPSVFPTAGFANPVLTTVALAIRLADHLKSRARAAGS